MILFEKLFRENDSHYSGSVLVVMAALNISNNDLSGSVTGDLII